MPSIDGLISGIDTTTIIEGLLQIKQQQITNLETRKEEVLARKAAFQGIEARLLSFRSTAAQIGRTQNSVFDSRTVTVSNDSFVAASASSRSAVGVYQIRVNSLARAHQVAAQGYADPDSEITQGTLDIRVGSGAVTSFTIDGTNNTLQGLADAINASSADVTASIIKDGSGGATPYRLLLTSKKSGAENQITVTNNLAASSGGAVRPDFDFLNPVQEGTDASVSLGSGPGAITVTSSTNRIDDLIGGVTIDLLKADPAQEISLTVAANTEASKAAIEDFVTSFNDLMKYIDEQVRFDAATNSAGLLLGNRSAIQLQDQIRRAVTDVVPGVSTNANRLSAIGISVTDKGHLQIDSGRLDDVLNGRVAGIATQDVGRLFAMTGDSNHPQVQFVLGNSNTKTSTTPYGVDITQAAERASITAATPLADSIVIDSSNHLLSLSVDGALLSDLVIADGTYTRDSLVQQLQSVINAAPGLSGRSVSVGLDGTSLRITSDAYGAASKIDIEGGTALAALGLTGTETDQGVDVAGSFIVDGQTEAAVGRGRVLSGNADNANTADLQVRVALSPGQVVAGVEASVTVTRGVAARLDQLLGSMLDSVTGSVKQVEDRFDQTADDIQKSIDRQNARFEAAQESLIRQFTALESAISSLQTTSSYLASQLASLKITTPNSR
jgi:flagellar hook-associated protein 2